MLSVVFSWIFCFSSASIDPAKRVVASDTITVHGLCWNVTTGRNLKSTISALVDGRKVKVGQSDADGQFKLRVADSTQILSFEVDGYPVTSLPINKSGAIDTSARFWFDLPMISKDSQQVIKAYQAAHRPSDSPLPDRIEEIERGIFKYRMPKRSKEYRQQSASRMPHQAAPNV